MFTLAHLSDPHLGPLPKPVLTELFSKRGLGFLNWLRKRRAIHRPEVLARIVDDLRSQPADHIAVTGDLVNLSLSGEFGPGRDWLGRLGTPERVSVVPGNHDRYVRAAAALAEQHWGEYMRGDGGEGFPYVRRRGPLALIGLSSALPTLPLAATGRLVGDQLARLAHSLDELGREGRFRVVLIHHPPIPGVNRFRRLHDGASLRDVLRRHGAELVLHGHMHEGSIGWLSGPRFLIPCVGVPSASAALDGEDEPAGYNLYEIEGEPGAWRCTAVTRGISRERETVHELLRTELADCY